MISMQKLGFDILSSMAQDFRPEQTVVWDDSGTAFAVALTGFEPSSNFKIIGEHRCQEWIEVQDCTNHVWVPV